MGPGLSFGIDMGILYQGEEECGSGHLGEGALPDERAGPQPRQRSPSGLLS